MEITDRYVEYTTTPGCARIIVIFITTVDLTPATMDNLSNLTPGMTASICANTLELVFGTTGVEGDDLAKAHRIYRRTGIVLEFNLGDTLVTETLGALGEFRNPLREVVP